MSVAERRSLTGRELLCPVLTPSDRLSVSEAGELYIEGVPASRLVEEYGSPLVVSVAGTVAGNYRRLERAFASCWPGEAAILYSFKSNNSLAYRNLLSRLGAGGDCFGENELRATLEAGTPPERIALNGSSKSPELIARAVGAGVTVNIDGEEEIAFIAAAVGSGGKPARANLRLKVLPGSLPDFAPGMRAKPGGALEWVERAKWGFLREQATALVREALATPAIELTGFSCHIGHLSCDPGAFAAVAGAFGEAVMEIAAATGFQPRVLDIGGGWAREREPEQATPSHPRHPIEEQAKAACEALGEAVAGLASVPALWVEPGRYLIGNGDVLLARVGAIKEDGGRRWLNLDISTNFLPRIETGRFHYDVLAAERLNEVADDRYEIVGETCFRSVIGENRLLPPMRRGDIVCILDAGMYSWSLSNNLNSLPRPANVLISEDGGIDLVRRRESFDDLFATQSVPERYKAK